MQVKRILVIVAAVVLVGSLAAAEHPSTDLTVRNGITSVRSNGTLGSFTASIVQTGPLQVDYSATVTTAGGDGAPLVTTVGTLGVLTLNDQVRVAAQLYDSPWSLHTWTTFNGEYFVNSPTALGSFTATFSATVPRAANYQVWAAAIAGHTWPYTSYNWFDISQGVSGNSYTITAGPMATTYVDSVVQPTPTQGGPTPTPNQSELTPVPTLSALGMALMGILLAGIGLLVLRRTN